ncbi:hypothetical protein Avbf_02539 [Armadillidium vulgare]|nr:hypothetical protein Avbf_02539 [Armadillidium vulgare]
MNTKYPSRFDYDNITESLLNQYPKLYLRDGFQRAFEGWKRSITQIFRNERERMNPASLPQVLLKQLRSRKRRPSSSSMNNEAETPLAKEESLWSFKYYLPGRTTGETDQSIQNHIQFLKNEKNKGKPNYEDVSTSLRATFGDRRNKIVLQQEFCCKCIIFEYGRICGSNYCSEIEKHFVDIHLDLKNLEREKSQISVGVCSIQTHEEDEGFLVFNGFKSLISLMNEKVEDFFVKKEFLCEDSTPVIVYSGDSVAKSLSSTPVIVYSGDSVAKSLSSTPYAKKHYKTLSYIEKFMLKISKTSDTKCSKLICVKV